MTLPYPCIDGPSRHGRSWPVLLLALVLCAAGCDDEGTIPGDDDDTTSEDGITVTRSEVIPTVFTVEWTPAGTPDSAYVEFGLDTDYGVQAPAEDQGDGTYQAVLIGLKAGSEYHLRTAEVTSDGTVTGEDHTATTGAVPPSFPSLDMVMASPDEKHEGFMLTTLLAQPPVPVIRQVQHPGLGANHPPEQGHPLAGHRPGIRRAPLAQVVEERTRLIPHPIAPRVLGELDLQQAQLVEPAEDVPPAVATGQHGPAPQAPEDAPAGLVKLPGDLPAGLAAAHHQRGPVGESVCAPELHGVQLLDPVAELLAQGRDAGGVEGAGRHHHRLAGQVARGGLQQVAAPVAPGHRPHLHPRANLAGVALRVRLQ